MFSVAYKKIEYETPGGWIDLFATGALTQGGVHAFQDRTGDHIAELNSSFGELTAHYWVLKNMNPTEYVGFCHYRRYFNLLPNPQFALPKLFAEPSDFILNYLGADAQREQAERLLKTYDIITTRQYVLDQTISQQFCSNHATKIWELFIDRIRKVAPDWIINALEFFDVSHEFRFYPIYITRWDIFSEFTTLLFDIILPLWNQIGDIPDTEGARFQLKRYPAYLAERFFMLYLFARRLRVYGAQLITLEHDC